jgi:predicted RNase H-like HicB family nuclease
METIHFHITREYDQYVAEGVEAAIVTQAPSVDELLDNIREAVEVHFEE